MCSNGEEEVEKKGRKRGLRHERSRVKGGNRDGGGGKGVRRGRREGNGRIGYCITVCRMSSFCRSSTMVVH
jgi:hypothetical protein